jgi:tRNA acetyltransferase TAN1
MGDGQKGKRGGGGGGGGGGKRGRWHKPSSSSAAIPYGTRGVVVTCEQGKERAACRDVARALDEVFEAKFPSSAPPAAEANADEDPEAGDAVDPPPTASPRNAPVDPSDALAAELRQLKEEKSESRRFEYLNLDFKACAFVRMHADSAQTCEPSELVHALLAKARAGEARRRAGEDPGFVPRSRHVLRLVPADDVCFAGLEEIKKAAKTLIETHFPNLEKVPEGEEREKAKKTFAVSFASRANSSVKRADAIAAVADLVPKGHAVDLTSPDLTIAVEVIKGTCCLSVLREYYGLLKYNWRMLGLSDEERAAERSRGRTATAGETRDGDGKDAKDA